LFRDDRFAVGVIGCIKKVLFLSPFSTSFGGITFLREDDLKDLSELEGWYNNNIGNQKNVIRNNQQIS
jgi:hypothetical protein